MKYRFIPLHAKAPKCIKTTTDCECCARPMLIINDDFYPCNHSLAECAALNSFIWLQFARSDHVRWKAEIIDHKESICIAPEKDCISVKGGQKDVTEPMIVAWSLLRSHLVSSHSFRIHRSNERNRSIYLFRLRLSTQLRPISHVCNLYSSFSKRFFCHFQCESCLRTILCNE